MKVITKAILDIETMKWIEVESYDYKGPVDLCCGPSTNEKTLESSAQSFSNLLQSDFSSRFANQDAVLGKLNQSLSPIEAAGPSQRGFSAAETAALNTTAIDSAGAANRNARQAVAGFGAGRGSDSGLESGVQKQLEAGVASSSANQLAGAQLGITKANYDQGSANYWRSVGGMDALASAYNPSAYSSQAIGANQNAFGEAKTITDQTNAEQAAIGGAIAGAVPFVGGGIAKGVGNLDTTGGSTGGEQFSNFLSGFMG
jgi:hypothetical protein